MSLEEVIFGKHRALMDKCLFQDCVPWDSSKQILEQPKFALLKPRAMVLLFALFPPLRILNFTFMVTEAKVVPDLHILS